MRPLSILVMAWMVSGSGSGTAARPQDAPAGPSTQSPASKPSDATQNASPNPESPAAEQGAPDSAAKKKAEVAPASKSAKRRRPPKRSPKPTPSGQPRKTVVREGGATAPPAQIVPGVTPQEASQKRQKAQDLLKSTEESLKQLAGRTLDSRQQETVAQIHNYAGGARSALKDGDTERAHTLALKAHLLAEDLVKH